MKRLINLVALVVLVSVNAFTPISYAQETEDFGVLKNEIQQNEVSSLTPIEAPREVEEANGSITVSYADNVVTYIDSQGNEFEMGTITISDGENSITMLDRNLGATDTKGEEAYGYHFQRGNNYGFDWRNVPDHAVGQVNAEDYGWHHPYSSNIFLKLNPNWDSSNNNYLWWDDMAGDYAMQGPCPAGYHVPSIEEWDDVLEMYYEIDSKGGTIDHSNGVKVDGIAFRKAFQDAFYIPLAGFRNNDYQLTNQGSEARFWTSTPDNNDSTKSRRFYVGNNVVDSINTKERVYGYSVRCFQNTDDSDTVTLSFDTRGGSTIQPILWPEGDSNFEPSTPTKEGDKFLGWYLDNDLSVEYDMYSPINNDTTFYAKWRSDAIIYEDNATTYTDTLGNVFSMGSITITNGTDSITILDRNLGATDTKGEEAYGYHFQWGNNYGFPWYDEIQLTGEVVDASGYNRHSPYVSDKFIMGGEYWDDSENEDLWGDTVDEDYARQGPCPDGYHVPSIYEWGALIDLYSNVGGFTSTTAPFQGVETAEATPYVLDPLVFREEFQEVFRIPLANRRNYNNGQIQQLGLDARIWSSTSYDDGVKAGRFYVGGTTVDTSYNQRAYGYSVRCFKNIDDSDDIVLRYEVNGGTAIQAQTLPKGATGYLPGYTTSKDGDELVGWYTDASMTTPFDFDSQLTQNTTIYAKWSLSHVVKFKDRDGSILKLEVVNQGESATAPANPSRNGYTFKGWDKPINNITQDTEINAVYEKISGGSSGGGGGGGNTHKTDSKGDGPNTENTQSSDDKKPQESQHGAAPEDTNLNNGGSSKTDISTQQLNIDVYDDNYTEEFNRAYQFSSNNNVTSTLTIKDAKMYTPLTRIQMAKMLSQYAMNVLDQEPDLSRGVIKFRDVTNKMNAEYDDAVTLAYQLEIMGINMPNNEFRPNDIVTRGEFATALSRMVYGTSDGQYKQTSKYYTLHIQKLEQEKILTNVDPTMTELRGYVMIMLMRLASKI